MEGTCTCIKSTVIHFFHFLALLQFLMKLLFLCSKKKKSFLLGNSSHRFLFCYLPCLTSRFLAEIRAQHPLVSTDPDGDREWDWGLFWLVSERRTKGEGWKTKNSSNSNEAYTGSLNLKSKFSIPKYSSLFSCKALLTYLTISFEKKKDKIAILKSVLILLIDSSIYPSIKQTHPSINANIILSTPSPMCHSYSTSPFVIPAWAPFPEPLCRPLESESRAPCY